ncbi:MAG: hypothetical protein LBU21_02645 [Treponema sp.]|jgi:hypothetical protein|nr:hypothetical protein [Treponema sp.]
MPRSPSAQRGSAGFLSSQKLSVDVKGQVYGIDSAPKKIMKKIAGAILQSKFSDRKTAAAAVVIIDIAAKIAYILTVEALSKLQF